MTDQLDTIFTSLGTGYWNWIHYIAVALAIYIPTPHTLAGAFVTPRLKFWSLNPPEEEDDVFRNDSSLDSCRYYDSSREDNPQRGSCEEWVFDNSTFTNTATAEFELICQMDYMRATYQSIYMIGVLVGSPLNGVLADRYGRKTTFMYGNLIYTVLAFLSCWVPDLTSLLVTRFLLGTMHTLILKTGYIIDIRKFENAEYSDWFYGTMGMLLCTLRWKETNGVEIASPKVRYLVGVVIVLPWALGTISWGGLGYLIRSWRILLTVSSIPCIILLPILWYMDESPRWLIVNGQHERALLVLKRAARWNKAILPSDDTIRALMNECYNSTGNAPGIQENVAKKQGFLAILNKYVKEVLILIRTPRLRIVTIVTHIQYLVLGMVFFGLTLGGEIFSVNVFLYMALMGVGDLPAYTIVAPIVSRFGRRLPLVTCFLISGISLLIQPFIPSGHQWLLITCTFIGKMTISMAFQDNNLYGSELFPTEVRTRGLSSAFMMSRAGSSIAPFINEYLSRLYSWAPFVVFGIAAATAGFVTLILWETKGLALPDTIAHLERPDFQSKKRYNPKIAPVPDTDLKEIDTKT